MFDKISFFGMPIKTLGSLGKIRVGRVTGNTHIFFFGLKGPYSREMHPNDACRWLTVKTLIRLLLLEQSRGAV